MTSALKPVLLVLAALIAAWAIQAKPWHHKPADRSTEIAAQVGGDCTRSSYYLQNPAGGGRAFVYDCWIRGRWMCVTSDRGIVEDVTVEVRALFANVIGGARPACANP